MRDLSPWLGLCHIRKETDDTRSSQQILVAAWADSVEGFEREVHFYTNTHGLQMILAEEVLPADDWMAKHPDRKDAQRLAAKVSAKHPVEIGMLGAGAGGVDGQPDDSQGYLHIEEIKGVEPLDSQFGVHPTMMVPDALYEPLFGQPDPTPAELAHYGGADKVPPLSTYAILDAAKVVNLVEMLEASGLEHHCLFKGEAIEEMRDVAPYVVQLEEDNDFTRKLFSHDPEQEVPWFMWDREPGIYVRSRGSLEEMWKHFRKFTKVQDEDGKWFYFRFWEPQTLPQYLSEINGWHERVESMFVAQSGFRIEFIAIANQKSKAYRFSLAEQFEPSKHSAAFQITKRDMLIFQAGQAPRLKEELALWLIRYDALRFRPFGGDRLKALVEHGIAQGNRFKFVYKEEYAHLLYMMSFLGGWFHESPLHHRILERLEGPPLDRYLNISANFPQDYMALFHTGAPPDNAISALNTLLKKLVLARGSLDQITANDAMKFAKLYQDGSTADPSVFAIVKRDAFAACDRLLITAQTDREVFYVLWLFLGPRFHEDPIFPWAGEKLLQNDNIGVNLLEVSQYALRRLGRVDAMMRRRKNA